MMTDLGNHNWDWAMDRCRNCGVRGRDIEDNQASRWCDVFIPSPGSRLSVWAHWFAALFLVMAPLYGITGNPLLGWIALIIVAPVCMLIAQLHAGWWDTEIARLSGKY